MQTWGQRLPYQVSTTLSTKWSLRQMECTSQRGLAGKRPGCGISELPTDYKCSKVISQRRSVPLQYTQMAFYLLRDRTTPQSGCGIFTPWTSVSFLSLVQAGSMPSASRQTGLSWHLDRWMGRLYSGTLTQGQSSGGSTTRIVASTACNSHPMVRGSSLAQTTR